MQLGQSPLLTAVFVGDPHSGIDGPLTQALVFGIGVDLGDDHIAAIAASSLQITPTGGVILTRRDNLEEISPHGHKVVSRPKILTPGST